MAAAIILLSAVGAKAQTDGTYVGYSPYSVFGIGQMHQIGTSWNRGMGGVGIAARSHRYNNILNPASVTERDSLSFMVDFGLNGRLSLFSEVEKKGINATVNLDDFALSFPITKHSAMMVGVTPVSEVGYGISYDEIDVNSGLRTFTSKGNGGMYQVFIAGGITFFDRLSIGGQFNYRFGNIDKGSSLSSSNESYRTAVSGDSLQVHNFTGKIGLQYEQPLAVGHYLTIGATYQFSTKLLGNHIHYRELGDYDSNHSIKPLQEENLRMGSEIGVGISYRKREDLLIEVDYNFSDWRNSNFENVAGFSNVGDVRFASSFGQTIRAGFEYTPNRNDLRNFMNRCTYRGGVYFDSSYYTVDGAHVNAVGVTIGMTVPVFRWFNGISVSLDFGRRGLATSQLKETYFGYSLGFNLFDLWFMKRTYD